MWPNPQETDLVTFTEEILNGKLHFFVQYKKAAKRFVTKREFFGAVKENNLHMTFLLSKHRHVFYKNIVNKNSEAEIC